MDIDLLRMLAASRSLNLSYNFSSLKGVPVVLWEPAFALRRKGVANVDNSFDFAACAIVFGNGRIEHVIKLKVESYEFVSSVLV